MKAVGQGLGFELRRISFARGNWLDCCISDNHAIFMDGHEGSSRRSCTLAPCAEVACNAHFCGSATGSLGDVESDGRAYDRGRMDRVGIAEVRVRMSTDWSNHVPEAVMTNASRVSWLTSFKYAHLTFSQERLVSN